MEQAHDSVIETLMMMPLALSLSESVLEFAQELVLGLVVDSESESECKHFASD